MRTVWWDLDDDPNGNVQHIARHGVTRQEVQEVLDAENIPARSRSSGRPMVFGETSTGRWIGVVYEDYGDDGVYPVTAFEVQRP